MKTKSQLPMGWQESPVTVGDPLDAGTPEDEWDTTAKPRYPRKELKFWYRGDRYVRICEVLVEKDDVHKYCIHIGWIADDSEDDLAEPRADCC